MSQLDRIEELLADHVPDWVSGELNTRGLAAMKEGASPRQLLRSFGLEWILDPLDESGSVNLDALRAVYRATKYARRTEDQKEELRSLAEECLAEGHSRRHIARFLQCSDGQIRQILNPHYLTQTPEERERHRLEQNERIEMMS